MSAGQFERSFYALDNGDIARARVQPETLAGFNPAAAGPATVPGSARMGGGRRRFGINARFITAVWDGAPPTGYDPNGVIRIPIVTPAAYNAINLGDSLSYLGGTLEVIGKTGEKVA
jgi:hypothetical protein